MHSDLDRKIASGLTERQREVLTNIATGQHTKGIADHLKLSPKTVEYHRKQLMVRLNIFDIANLTRFAIRAGLIQA